MVSLAILCVCLMNMDLLQLQGISRKLDLNFYYFWWFICMASGVNNRSIEYFYHKIVDAKQCIKACLH